MPPSGLRRFGLLIGGILMGLFGVALGLWFYLQAARIDEVRTNIGEQVRVARESIERIDVLIDGSVRFRLRDVTVSDVAGDTILSAPTLILTLDPESLAGTGPIEFYDVQVVDPLAKLMQTPDGEWNYLQAFQVTAAGQPVETEQGRPILLRDIQVTDGRIVWAIPVEAPPPAEPGAFVADLPWVTIGGVSYQQYRISDVQARLSSVRIGGTDGWRADVAAFTGQVAQPELRISQLEGWAEQEGEDGIAFQVDRLAFGESTLTGAGLVRFVEDGLLYDAIVQAAPLRLADLETLFPTLDAQDAFASFELDVQSLSAVRHALAFSALDFQALDSRVTGAISFAMGGEAAPAVMDANLDLAPLDLVDLEQLGLIQEVPLAGRLTGRVTTLGAPAGRANVDIRASLLPRNEPQMTPSIVFASGTFPLVAAEDEMRLDGLTVGLQPLYLATFREMAPEMAERLRGAVQGSVSLAGTPTDLRLAGGLLEYEVGNAAPTRLTNVTGQITTVPELRYNLRAVAEPLALATLTELFPGLPFRTAAVSGPIEINGSPEDVRFTADLDGASGGIAFTGSLALGETPRFDVQGSLNAFATGMILRPEVPVEGPLTGTFSASGSTERFSFDVDLAQREGRFALTGTASLTSEPPRFDVAGTVSDFRVGALVGDPQLFPDPMSGSLQLQGGAGDRYTFAIDLIGEIGRLDLTGFYLPGDVPSYEARGYVAALDLSRLPTPVRLPPSAITGTVDVTGRGIDLETIEGSFALDATASTLSGMPLDVALARFDIQGGVMEIDTLHVQLDQTLLMASGSWGLQTPLPTPLRYSLSSPDLSILGRVLGPTDFVPPQIAGSVQAEGTVAGSVEYPIIQTTLTGNGLRFEEYRAEGLDLELDVRRTEATGWQGEIAMEGENLFTPQTSSIQALNLEASGTQGLFSFGFSTRRDAQTDLAASGTLELEGLTPQAVSLTTLTARLETVEWNLLQPARLRFTDAEGLSVEGLTLERSGPASGIIAIDGAIPPTGFADLDLSITAFDLSDLQRILPSAPSLEGLLNLDLTFNGDVSAPELFILARVDQLRYEGAALETFTFQGTLVDDQLAGFGEATAQGARLFRADVAVPIDLSLEDLVPSFALLRTDPAQMTLVADSLPLDLIAAVLPGFTDGVGVARAQVEVGGTLDAPELEGWVRLADGAITIDSLSVRYTDIDADIALTQSSVVINSLSVVSDGTFVASGSVEFPANGPARVALSAGLEGFRLMNDPEVAQLTVSAQLAANGPLSGPTLTGWVEALDSEIQVPELAQQDATLELAYLDVGGELGPLPAELAPTPPPFLGNVLVDGLELIIGESVWLNSDEMRVQVTGDLVVYRAGENIRVFGAAEAVRGTYALAISGIVREFEVIRGRIQFFGTGDLNPSLDILAGYRVRGTTIGQGGDLTVLVQLGGTMLSPTVALGSDTTVPLPESDLISYLLFGQPNFELGGVNSQFAQQLFVQEVVGNFLASELQRPILRAGLCDWVRVRPGLPTQFSDVLAGGPLTNAAIECGWELTSELSVTAETGLGILQGETNVGRVGLEWQIDSQWMWDASYGRVERNALTRIFNAGRLTQFSTEIRRQWEYGLPSQDSPLDLLPPDPDAPPPDPPGLPSAPILEPSIGARNEEEPPGSVGGSS